jgi:hypothetical protein
MCLRAICVSEWGGHRDFKSGGKSEARFCESSRES